MRQTIEPAELVHQLAAKMRARNLEWDNTTAWTKALKDSLRELLEQDGSNITQVLYSDSESDRHEFMLDVVVWDRSQGEGVTLAVESEWLQDVDSIAEDFWKLLVIKAPIKLMIFACNKNPRHFSQEAVWAKLSECLTKFRDHVAGERYIFMDYAPRPARSGWWIEIPAHGHLSSVPIQNRFAFD